MEGKDNNLDNIELKPLRTFQEDVKNVVDMEGISSTSILLAEQKKKLKKLPLQPNISTDDIDEKSPEKSFNLQGFLTIVFSIVLVMAGVGVGYYAYLTYLKNIDIENAPTIQREVAFIDPDNIVEIDSKNRTLRQVTGDIREIIKKQEAGEGNDLIEIAILKPLVVDNEVFQEQLNSEDLFTLIESNAPSSLIRSLTDDMTLGVHKLVKMEPFIILETTDLNQTYSGMISWERDMIDDIRDIFFENLGSSQIFEGEVIVTGTSTESVDYLNRDFRDIVVSNQDARAMINDDNEVLFFWSIVNGKYVIITTNKDTFDRVINRINVAKLIR